MSIDWTQFQAAVRDGARAAFREVRAVHPSEHFYAFALYTDDGVMTVVPAANSEESFGRKGGGKAEAAYYRWATGEWAYKAVGSEHFGAAYVLLNGEGRDGEDAEAEDEWEESPQFAEFRRQVIESLVGALVDLEGEGFFGRGAAREGVTVFVSVSDSDDTVEIENESARRLNPPAVYERFAGRYQ